MEAFLALRPTRKVKGMVDGKKVEVEVLAMKTSDAIRLNESQYKMRKDILNRAERVGSRTFQVIFGNAPPDDENPCMGEPKEEESPKV